MAIIEVAAHAAPTAGEENSCRPTPSAAPWRPRSTSPMSWRPMPPNKAARKPTDK